MPGLNKEEIKARIEAEIAKTSSLIEEYKELTQPVEPENSIGRISRMDAINNKSVTEAALRKAKDKLEKLNYAFSKVNDAEFGLCTRCRTTIPIERILMQGQTIPPR